MNCHTIGIAILICIEIQLDCHIRHWYAKVIHNCTSNRSSKRILNEVVILIVLRWLKSYWYIIVRSLQTIISVRVKWPCTLVKVLHATVIYRLDLYDDVVTWCHILKAVITCIAICRC
ncbi:hypothetical protein DRQ53_10030 [bacterium]|nr:MAG: hypothetical protein DRQ53_10030 [bacterium]